VVDRQQRVTCVQGEYAVVHARRERAVSVRRTNRCGAVLDQLEVLSIKGLK